MGSTNIGVILTASDFTGPADCSSSGGRGLFCLGAPPPLEQVPSTVDLLTLNPTHSSPDSCGPEDTTTLHRSCSAGGMRLPSD
jgi:hypothetical protein